MDMRGWTVRDKPAELPGPLVERDDTAPRCVLCGSSQVWPLGWFGRLIGLAARGCIQPLCDRWWQHGR